MTPKTISKEQKDIEVLHSVYRGAVNMSLHHSHDAYEITCVLSGRRILFAHGRQYVIDPHHPVIVPGGVPHKTISCDNNPQESVSIQFRADFFERLLGEEAGELLQMLPPMLILPELSEKTRQQLEKQLRVLVETAKTQGVMRELYLKTAFLNVFMTLFPDIEKIFLSTSHAQRQAMAKSDSVFREIIAYLDNNYRQRISLEMLSEKFHLSKSRLSLKLNLYLGMSWVTYVNTLRIQDAQRMLETSHNNISEVAASVGFDSLTHFERVFKTIQGVTPREYIRKQKIVQTAGEAVPTV